MTVIFFSVFLISSCSASGFQPGECNEQDSKPNVETNIQRYWARLTDDYMGRFASSKWKPIPKDLAFRMVGAIENSFGISAPPFWTKTFVGGSILLGKDKELRRLGMVSFEPMYVHEQLLNQISVESAGDEYSVTSYRNGNKLGTAKLPRDLLDSHNQVVTCAVFDSNNVYLAFVDQYEPTGRVVCVSRTTKKTIWSTNTKDYASKNYKGSTLWFIELVQTENEVFVFQICDLGVLVERHSKPDGTKRIVFNS